MNIQSFTFNPFSENTYILFNDSREAFIVDPGCYTEDEQNTLQKFISDKNLQVKNILLTHAHIDHVLGIQFCYNEYKVAVLMHENEQEILDRNPMTAKNYGFFFAPFDGEIQYLRQKDRIYLNDEILEILEVPGHSPGSIAFHNEAQKFVVSGDALFQGSIGRTDLYKGDHEQLINSIRTQLLTLSTETQVFSGHGNPTHIGFEKEYNPFF